MNNAIVIENLTKRYGANFALKGLSLEVKQGEVIGYLGPNGAGKTTTIRLILGLINPTAGSSKIFGIDSHKNKIQAHQFLSYVPGEANLWPNLTGAETLYLLGNIKGNIDEKYKAELIKRFDFDVNKKVRSYSKGNKQKLNLIAGLMSRSKILILDEPTSGLDPLMEQAFRQSIGEAKSNGQTIFLSSHILSEVEALCDRVAILRLGELIQVGTLDSMRHLTSLNITATFASKPPSLEHIPGVRDLKVAEHQISCKITGPVDQLLSIISKHHPLSFTCKELSLEEIFLSHYGKK